MNELQGDDAVEFLVVCLPHFAHASAPQECCGRVAPELLSLGNRKRKGTGDKAYWAAEESVRARILANQAQHATLERPIALARLAQPYGPCLAVHFAAGEK